MREVPGGTRFYYASSQTQTLALALRAAVGVPLAEYLSEKIRKPMGGEADATWLIVAAQARHSYGRPAPTPR
jgi:CubicO group peptidase (beta-lactamase class C family)